MKAVSVPRLLLDGPMFGDGYQSEWLSNVIIREAKEGRGAVYYSGLKLGPEHRAVWKVILTQLKLQMDLGIEGVTLYIYEDEIFNMMGRAKITERMRSRLGEVLVELVANSIHSGGDASGKLLRHVSTFDGLCEIEVGLPEKAWLDGEQYIDVPTTSQAMKIARRPVPLDWHEDREAEWQRICDRLHKPVEKISDEQGIESPKKARGKATTRTPGFVYILTNPSMPGLIKIGRTRLDPADRAAQLHTTGVPAGFQVEYACRTPNPEAVEQAMHVAFGPRRVNDRREFFEIEPDQAIAVLALHHQAEPSTTIQ